MNAITAPTSTIMSARAQVESLLALIKESAFQALDEYEKCGKDTPTLDSLQAHPLDRDDAVNKLELKKMIRTLEAACDQLCSTLAPPTHSVMKRSQDFGWACLRVAVKQNVADALLEHPDGLHVQELSTKVNIHPVKLAAILKVLATRHCFREVAPDVFANNRLSLCLLSTHPMSAKIDTATLEAQMTAGALADYLINSETGHSMAMNEAAFQYTKKDTPYSRTMFFDWMSRPEQAERRTQFSKSMIAVNGVLGALAPVHVYDWDQVKTFCDVGSGIGHFSKALLNHTTGVKATLFDLPKTIEVARADWGSEFSGRVDFVGGSFLEEIPVKNCDIYYIRNVLHNWSDEKALQILRTVREAMGSHSRLLLHEHVLRHACRTESTEMIGLDDAPEPLLPNYGEGQMNVYQLNMVMLMWFNTHERTPSELSEMIQTTGLRLVKVYDLAEMCLLELGVA
ncbi:S-adenosyl-L-methionine-dependent methyltransferase [Pholiota conissans]|uniref:S-adenosyl-L-methionine-dependent methyltransferase n=1 Tax=Pholiota conissans TaxID=109636 RepID=A0A9P6CXW0_9AGAR|nr:S-adenosyl-L-methionine-dependent methyltransferase [Pholiota conissans]